AVDEHLGRDVEVVERGIGLLRHQRDQFELGLAERDAVADAGAERLGPGAAQPGGARRRDAFGVALDAVAAGNDVAAAQRIAVAEYAQVAELQARIAGVADAHHGVELERLAVAQAWSRGRLADRALDRTTRGRHRGAARAPVGL